MHRCWEETIISIESRRDIPDDDITSSDCLFQGVLIGYVQTGDIDILTTSGKRSSFGEVVACYSSASTIMSAGRHTNDELDITPRDKDIHGRTSNQPATQKEHFLPLVLHDT